MLFILFSFINDIICRYDHHSCRQINAGLSFARKALGNQKNENDKIFAYSADGSSHRRHNDTYVP